MISQLTGILLHKEPPTLTLDVQGIGYEIEAPMTTFYVLPDLKEQITLFTHLNVREDAHVLYGFHDKAQRRLFRLLIKVNGVGPKLALGILSGVDVDEFLQLIRSQDTARLTKLPGIGKKTAERLIIEMRDRLKADFANLPEGNMLVKNMPASPEADAKSALIALGYKPPEVNKMFEGIEVANLSSEEMIKRALQRAWKP